MHLKRNLLELAVGTAGLVSDAFSSGSGDDIFVLRNNDIGDLLVITPLFEALKKRFPNRRIVAGVGSWNLDVLRGNEWVDEVLEINAPWHNKKTAGHSPSSGRGLSEALRYICNSPELRNLRRRKCGLGIDVLGSPQGAMLLMRAGIPFRLGMRGYAGGHSASHLTVEYNSREHVGRLALRFAELLGAHHIPEARPQLFLTSAETDWARDYWSSFATADRLRVLIGPGGGFPEKCWPGSHFARLAQLISTQRTAAFCIVGSQPERSLGDVFDRGNGGVMNAIGSLSLRQTFALCSTADLVLCNSSMLMHVSAAFRKRTAVCLGETYADARAHHDQWGYESDFAVLGKSASRASVFSPEEVFQVLRFKAWI